MQSLGFILLIIIVFVTALRPKTIALAKTSILAMVILMMGIAIPSYLIFGQPNYDKQNSKTHLTFNAVSPEQNMALHTFEILKSENSQSVDQWQDVAIALRLQRAFTKSSYAYGKAAQFADNATEKASFYGAAGEALVEQGAGNVSEEAAQLFTQALEQDPAAIGALYYLGIFNEAAKNEVAAIEHYRNFLRRAEKDHPRLVDVNTRLFSLSGKTATSVSLKIAPALTSEAIKEFKSLPEDQQAEFLQSMMMRRFNTLETQGGSPSEWRDLARYFQRLGNTEQALKTYNRAITLSPDNIALQLERNQLEN